MTETNFPSGIVPPGQTPQANGSEPNARLIGVPNEVRAELQTRQASLRIQGEVVRQNDDGSIRVRTTSGDIDVRLRDGQEPPPRGTRVEIEIQPSRNPERPPEAATLRELPRADAPPPRQSATPVEVEVRPQQEARQPLPADVRHSPNANERPAQPTTPQPLPPEGSVVRLQPLPVRVAEALPLPEITQQIISTITQPAIFQAQLIAARAVDELQQALVTQRPALLPAPVVQNVTLPNPDIVLPQTVTTTTAPIPAPPIVQTITAVQPPLIVPEVTPAPLPPVVINTQNFTPNIQVTDFTQARQIQTAVSTTPVLSVPAPTPQLVPPIITTLQTPQALPVAPQILPQTPVPIVLKPLALDAVIERISPPNVILTIPPDVQGLPTNNQPAIGETQTIVPRPENIIVQNQNAPSVTGIVTNITNDSLPVVTVFFPQLGSEQIFTLQFPTDNIALGTQIQFTPQATATAQPLTTPTIAPSLPLPVYLTPGPWPAFDEALQTLARAALPTAQAMVNVTPSPANPAQLGPALLFFIAAVRGGDLSQWLGQKANEILRTQKGGSALNRLMGENATLARVSAEPIGQDWRAVNVPLYWDNDMHKIALYYKHEHDGADDEKGKLKSTRFVFDLALDVMGKVQLDGLFRPATGQLGRLDLVVRTEDQFSQNTQAEMRRIYAKALKETQVTGELSFQNQADQWVTIHEQNNNSFSAET